MINYPRFFRNLVGAFLIAAPLYLATVVTYAVLVSYPPTDGVWLKNDQVLGGDFLAFYTGGTLFREAPARLYDLVHQVAFQKAFLGGSLKTLASPLPFVYPPLIAVALYPVSYLSFEHAFYLTAAIAFFASLLALAALARFYQLPFQHSNLVVLVGGIGFMPFYLNTIYGGQLAWLGILIFSCFAILLLKKKYFLAGAVLALGYYKPPLFVIAALYFYIRLGAPFIKGTLISALVLTMLSIAAVGFDGLLHYIAMASRYTYGQEFMPDLRLPPSQGAGIFALMTSWLSASVLNYSLYAFLCSIIIMLAVYKRKRDEVITPIEIALVITSSVGLSVQCIKYDVAILLVPFLLFASDFHNIDSKIKYFVLVIIFGFYIEYVWREKPIFGVTGSISSLLFIFLISLLYIIAVRLGQLRPCNGVAVLVTKPERKL